MILEIETEIPASPITKFETCIVCHDVTFETCNQCEQPIHHSEERSLDISCWVRHWKTHRSMAERPVTQFPAA